MSDRDYLWLAQLFYAVTIGLTIWCRRTGGRANFATTLCGFALHTMFLVQRGHALARCPLTNNFEVLAFIAWSAVLFYLVIGSAYRVSFLGAFTAPLVLALSLLALLVANDAPLARPQATTKWVEFHAAIAILAVGAFALGFVAGAMYLLQERQLKTRRLGPTFLEMPSMDRLDKINFRLIIMGFAMLTAGVIGGFVSYRIVGHAATTKIIWAVGAWVVYAGLLAARLGWSVRGRKLTVASMLSFVVMLVTFWGVAR